MKKQTSIYLKIIALLVFIIISFFRCSPNEPKPKPPEPKPEKTVLLSVTDFSPTEIYLKLVTENLSSDKSVEIYRDESMVFNFALNGTDTAVVDDFLFPSSSYSYHSLVIEDGKDTIYTDTITAATMDTTSHDFTWETYEFGGVNGSSYFSDVAIIDENDIWAVGEIHTEADFDSAGNYVGPYNAAHWNGEEWELKKIKWDNYVSRFTCVFAFSKDDVWFGVTNLIHWNGKEFVKNWNPILSEYTDKTVNSIWGLSSEDFYIVGNEGKIAHYNGSSWEKIENSEGGNATDLDIYDIWGDYNERKGEYEILAVAAKMFQSSERDIIKIENSKAEKIDESGIDWSLRSLWFNSGRKYILTGSGIYIKENLEQSKWWNNWQTITRYYIKKIRGNGINDIFLCGSYGEVIHYNGISWYSYLGKDLPELNGNLLSVSYKNRNVCIVGTDGRVGIIYLGK